MVPDDLKGIDLNLLVSFNALMDERSVSRAAERLQVTQPAMSKTLQRLRELFADPLFLRTARGLEPTARSLALEQPVMAALDQLVRLVAPPEFEPAQLVRTYVLAVPDGVAAFLVPPLLARLAREAPGVSLRLRNYARDSIRQLPRGSLDFVVGLLAENVPVGLHARGLFRDRSVCLMRAGHPLAGRERLSIDELVAFDHIRCEFKGVDGDIDLDRRLGAAGRHRPARLRLSHFATAVGTLHSSDALMPGLRHWAASPPGGSLAWVELPAGLGNEIDVHLLWDERSHGDPACRWFRWLLLEVARSVLDALDGGGPAQRPVPRAGGGFLS